MAALPRLADETVAVYRPEERALLSYDDLPSFLKWRHRVSRPFRMHSPARKRLPSREGAPSVCLSECMHLAPQKEVSVNIGLFTVVLGRIKRMK